MDIDLILAQLEAVRATGSGRWIARCPAHNDRSPSLSIREGVRAILIKCWAGCPLGRICSSLGILVRDLFYDSDFSLNHSDIQRQQLERIQRRQRERKAWLVKGLTIDARREADKLLRSARNIDISPWNEEKLDKAISSICDALTLLSQEDEEA